MQLASKFRHGQPSQQTHSCSNFISERSSRFCLFEDIIYRSPLALIGIVAGIAAIVIINYPGGSDWMVRVVCWGAPAAIILASAISLERNGLRVPNVLVSLGESSFSLYLVHIFVVAALAEAWAYCHLTTIMPAYVLGLTCFAAALAVSHLVHLQIEYPLNKWLKAAISGPASKRELPQRVSHRH